jgi:hypothetical protein
MASRKLRDRSDGVAFCVPFDNNVKLERQWRVLDFYSSPSRFLFRYRKIPRPSSRNLIPSISGAFPAT